MVTYEQLVELRDAAWTCNELAIEFLESGRTVGLSRSRYGKRPYFEPAATSQAKQYLAMTQRQAEKLQVAAARWHASAYLNSECPLQWIKVALEGKGRTFTIADQSVYTAHAATEKMVEYALSVWEEFEHYDEKKLALGIARSKRNSIKLTNLHGYIESEFEVAVAALDEQSSSRRPLPPIGQSEERDKFIYEHAVKGKAWKWISIQVAKNPEWGNLGYPNGVKKAATRYADRKGLPIPPPRQRGRRSAN